MISFGKKFSFVQGKLLIVCGHYDMLDLPQVEIGFRNKAFCLTLGHYHPGQKGFLMGTLKWSEAFKFGTRCCLPASHSSQKEYGMEP